MPASANSASPTGPRSAGCAPPGVPPTGCSLRWNCPTAPPPPATRCTRRCSTPRAARRRPRRRRRRRPRRRARLPWAWSGVSLAAEGATHLRVRLTRSGPATALTLADATGAPVARMSDALVSRPLAADQLDAGPADLPLYDLRWNPVPLPTRPATGIVPLDPGNRARRPRRRRPTGARPPRDHRAGRPARRHARPARRHPHPDPGLARRRPVHRPPAGRGHPGRGARRRRRSTDLAGAAVWGLVRSAQLEHPGRFVLARPGRRPAPTPRCSPPRSATGEPQLAHPRRPGSASRAWPAAGRAGAGARRRRPRRHRAGHRRHRRARRAASPGTWSPARGAGDLLLVSRRGPDAARRRRPASPS